MKQRLYVILTVILIALMAILLHSAFRKGGLWQPDRFNDFRAYHDAAVLAVDGRLPEAYSLKERPYQYPPTLASLILPLGFLPYRVALVVWVLVGLALLLCSFRVLDKVLCPPVMGLDKLVGFLLVYRLVESDFANTNANVLVLGIVIIGFWLERRERSVAAGMLLALAACVKVFPILIFPWLLTPSRRRMLGGFLLGLLFWGAIVPATVLGPSDYKDCCRAWYGSMISPMAEAEAEEPSGEEEVLYVAGQSIRTLTYHLLRRTDASAHDEEIVTVNVAHLTRSQVEWIYVSLGLLVCGLSFVVIRLRWRGGVWRGEEIAVACLLCVLVSPLARKAHFVMLLPAAVWSFSIVRSAVGSRRWGLGALWGLACGLVVLSSPGVLGPTLSKLVMAYCPLTFASLLLLAIALLPRATCRFQAVENRS